LDVVAALNVNVIVAFTVSILVAKVAVALDE
jgi:hypothetical protein